jgi:hypothetical protein
MLLAGILLLAVWWLVATLAGMPLSGPSPVFFVWFVAGVLLARILARLLTAFLARNGTPT